MSSRDGPGLFAALGGGLLLGMATPPAIAPFAEWLVVPALMIWFALASNGRRPLWHSYVYGCVHMAWFSWSVRQLLVPAYVSIVVLGGCYYLLASAAVRGAPKRLRVPAFAVAVAAAFWLRAQMPEIHYPHGQACHCLWQWPALMRSVTLGGEPLANGLLALFAASGVGVWRSWRVATPSWGVAWLTLAGAGGLFAVGNVGGWLLAPTGVGESLRVLIVEPGVHPNELRTRAAFLRAFRERLLAPTQRELAADASLDLVVWPESALPNALDPVQLDAGDVDVLGPLAPGANARVLAGVFLRTPEGVTPATLSIDAATGVVEDYQGKRRLVPGGEFLPLLGLLPDSLAEFMRELQEQVLGGQASYVPGVARPPMRTAAGRPFGTLICFDNAFPGPARELVAGGAQLLAVLSNETWFAGGGELTQLVAMSVVRALENATPVVRSTTDGWSVAIGADGRLLAALELRPAPQPEARILRVSVPPGSGHEPPMAWLRRGFGPFAAVLMALGLAHALIDRVRIRTARSAVPTAAGSGASGQS